MARVFGMLFVLAVAVGFLTAPVRAAVALNEDAAPMSIGQGAEAFYDPSGAISIDEVVRNPARFAPASALPSLPESNAPRAYWFRLHLARGSSTAPWTLRSSYHVTRVDLYVREGSRFTRVSAGFDLGALDQALLPGIVVLPEPALHDSAVYVRIASVDDPRAVRIAAMPGATATSLLRRIIFGILVGFFIAIGAFNLLMYLTLRDRSLINFAGVMFLSACRIAVSFGVFWQLLPPLTFLERELIFDTVALAGGLALAAFSIDFLKMQARDRRGIPIVVAGALLSLTVFITDFVPSATVAFDWTFVVVLAFYGTLLYAGIRAYRLGMRVARIYTAGIACTIAGYIVNMSSYALPHQELWVYALELGACCQAALLGLAVAESVQESRAEHEALVLETRHLEQLAMRDGLTNAFNRRSFDAALVDASRRAGIETVGILMIDIDRFKDYNDTLGHQAGDEALRLVARGCGSCVRAGDVFARYGGEEFAAIVPGASMAELESIAERMRASVIALGLRRADGTALTISVGGATSDGTSMGAVAQAVRDADAALYRAKNGGRNLVYVCGTVPLDAF